MKKTKKLLAVFAAVSVALMLPLQTMAAVDLNAKYDISTNQIQGWPAGPDIIRQKHTYLLLPGQHYQDHDLAGGSGELHHG